MGKEKKGSATSASHSVGLIYRSVWLYRVALRFIYGREYEEKYKAVAEEIPRGSVVVDLCCGDCKIVPYLEEKQCKFIGLDINPRFVEWAQDKGLDVRLWNVKHMEIPEGDVVCMQSALYQFHPHEKELIEKMLKSARKMIIISEPVWYTKTSWFKHLNKIAEWLTQVGDQVFSHRHSETSLTKLLSFIPPEKIKKKYLHREMIVIISK